MPQDRTTLPVVVPQLIDYLVARWPTLTGLNAEVFDGPAFRFDAPLSVMVGVDDAAGNGKVASGAGSLEWMHTAFSRIDEKGTLTCVIASWDGNGDRKAARSAAFAAFNVIYSDLRKNQCIGSMGIYSLQVDNYDLSQDQAEEGALALLSFTIGYQSRI